MRSLFLLLCIPLLLLPATVHAEDLTVPLPPGQTMLSDIGIYRVAYQSYGKQVVDMPVSWVGHFETVSGISYLPSGQMMGRDSILLHSPWRVDPGKVWVDYRLKLPEVKPITFSFGITMRPDVVVPGKSDGVTFSCYLVDGGHETELMRYYQKTAVWKDYSFDFSKYAGKTITLRLQTEPGPKNNPSFDYSYFGDAQIVAGNATTSAAALLRRLTTTRAYKATVSASRLALANNPHDGVVPSNLLPCKNELRKTGNVYEFIYSGADGRILYTYDPRTGTLADFTVQVNDERAFQPAADGGVIFITKGTESSGRAVASGGHAAKIAVDAAKHTLSVTWEYSVDGAPVPVQWTFGIAGKSLTVDATCEDPVVSGFSLGHIGMAPLRRTYNVPYLLGTVDYLPEQNVFTCRYLDWTRSHSSQCPRSESTYDPKTDGARNPLQESGYIAVSPSVDEVLPNLPSPPSPFLKELAPRIMLDIWGHHDGTFAGDAENIRNLKDNGIDHLAIIQHVWQRYGYDTKLPNHVPANPAFGGDAGMEAFGKAANDAGYIWSVHENYIDLYPDAPSYDPTARVLKADGTPSPAWFNKGTKVQSFGEKCNRALGYAKQNSPYIQSHYHTTAAYLDVHTCVPPWHELDHEADQPMAAMESGKVKYDTQLFQYMRDTHGGPLFGEGHFQFYWAGRCDGVEGQVDGGEDHDPFLDFDLLKIHPQMMNHGMGYYERWFRKGYDHRWGVDSGTPEQVDKYRAQELAYGHAGFVGNIQVDNVQWVAKEHHMMSAVQRLYGTAKVSSTDYEVDGQFVPASVALIVNQRGRQRIKYDDGLTIWVNWEKEPWTVEGHVLPQWGFLALGPNTEVWTALVNGKYADYVNCPEYLFVDARTSFNMPYLRGPNDITPKLRDFKYLGGDKVQVTYEWDVNQSLNDDYHCFVHFVNEAQGKDNDIVFQQDHSTPKPTSEWRKGDVIIDGPYTISVPDKFDSYDLLIGMFSKKGRLAMKGIGDDDHRYLIGRLDLHREDGKITNITLGDLSAETKKYEEARADFSAHMNAPDTRIDFGIIATDGSVKINKGADSLTLFPYPRDKAFDVSLNVKALAPEAAPAKVSIHALAALTQADMGAVPCTVMNGRVEFKVGKSGAGRYVVTW